MFQLSLVSWIFVVVSSLSRTSDAETKKEVKIVWSLSAAICVQRSAFEKSIKIQPSLKKLAPYRSLKEPLCSHIAKTKCEYLDCKRKFQCGKSEKNAGPRTGPNIIVRMKSQHKCEALLLPCNAQIGCTVNTTKRAFQAKSVKEFLRSHATSSQATVLNILKKPGSLRSALTIEPLWITNEIIVKGASLGEVQEMLKGNSDVAEVRLERYFHIPEFILNPSSKTERSGGVDDWNIKTVGADKVWAEGITGKGIVVGHIDTGVLGGHEALQNNWRGEYGWFDPYLRRQEPYDDAGHGTPTLGIAVGQTKRLGVAPGATWMSCKAYLRGGVNEGAFKTCAQWILCPTKADGSEPDCSKAPHVVNNSYAMGVFVNGSEALFQAEFEKIIACWKAAGIIPVFGAGNDGLAGCGKVGWPSVLDTVISVGNVRQNLDPNIKEPFKLASSSSRGPPHPRYVQKIKPDVSAPGTEVYSASWNGVQEYERTGGTSVAAPIVTGIIALLLEKHPSFNYDQVYSALVQSCSPVYIAASEEPCGNISLSAWPNHHMGFGMVNAYKTVFGSGTVEVEC